MMTQDELLSALKEVVVKMMSKANPGQTDLTPYREKVEATLNQNSLLSSLGWDSLQMTFLLVEIEDRFGIDTSNLSLLDLYTIGDLLAELQTLIENKKG
jgi:acyl carrier protein